MANENKDVIRHEDSTANLPSTSKPGMVTFETDVLQRQRRVMIDDNTVLHWTSDENRPSIAITENIFAKGGADGSGLVNSSVTETEGALTASPNKSFDINAGGQSAVSGDANGNVSLLSNTAYPQGTGRNPSYFSSLADVIANWHQYGLVVGEKIYATDASDIHDGGESYGELGPGAGLNIGIIGLKGLSKDVDISANTVHIVNDKVTPGSETIVWTPQDGDTPPNVDIHVGNGDDLISTTTAILAATVTGDPWATLSEVVSGLFLIIPGSRAMSALNNFVASIPDSGIFFGIKGAPLATNDSYIVISLDPATLEYIPRPKVVVASTYGELDLQSPDLAAGGMVKVDATTGKATIAVEGVDYLSVNGIIQKLSTTDSIDLAGTPGKTALYTVSTGKQCIVTRAMVRFTSIDTPTVAATGSIVCGAGDLSIFLTRSMGLGMGGTATAYRFVADGLSDFFNVAKSNDTGPI